MKKAIIFLFVLTLLLVGCQRTAPNNLSDELCPLFKHTYENIGIDSYMEGEFCIIEQDPYFYTYIVQCFFEAEGDEYFVNIVMKIQEEHNDTELNELLGVAENINCKGDKLG